MIKKPRVQDNGTYASAADPLTRVIVVEGYPEAVLTDERLARIRSAVSKEIDGIREGPVPRFNGSEGRCCGGYLCRCSVTELARRADQWHRPIGGCQAHTGGPGSASKVSQGGGMGSGSSRRCGHRPEET